MLSASARRSLELAMIHDAKEVSDAIDLATGYTGVPYGQYGTATNTTGFTATAAQVAGADNVFLNLTGALGAGATLTLPTAAQIFAQVPNAQVGQTYLLTVINTSSGAFSWTVAGGTGVTITGTATVAQNTEREFLVTLTSATAVAMQSLGQYAVASL